MKKIILSLLAIFLVVLKVDYAYSQTAYGDTQYYTDYPGGGPYNFVHSFHTTYPFQF